MCVVPRGTEILSVCATIRNLMMCLAPNDQVYGMDRWKLGKYFFVILMYGVHREAMSFSFDVTEGNLICLCKMYYVGCRKDDE
jgi:hypothetical protein